MPVNLNLAPATPVRGVTLATLVAGLKSNGSADMVVASLTETAVTAAVFTQSAFCAAPVSVAREQLQACDGRVRALLINSGNANAGTGQPGIDMANGHCQALAAALGVDSGSVLPFSTGVIGQLLPDDIMRSGIARAATMLEGAEELALPQWENAARGIMTTDTQPKLTSQSVTINGQDVTITGMAKGAGMIQPNMATMLSYVFTDATIGQDDLNRALRESVDVSFNSITVDSDTSTNDACVLVATGVGEALHADHPQWAEFMSALTRVCSDLAQAIIRDAEGATKFITVKVTGGRDTAECKLVGYAIANSPLVKTAMFASDANVGRLLAAIGKAGVDSLDASKVTVSLGDVVAFENAGIAAGYTEERGAAVMAREEIDVTVDLARGSAQATIYTSDLSHDYVSINADYRS
ncbi:bifunctional glutamate N-acetyltransferase/amino-acid acetyltransferase ArgJ [Granulosicoccus sp. 3-233]|uniref:bifunctional glutamate N-acetyltransferase/amino-acid acetyltransferase ArgJ n=1 Tax=Granulosicoccus sp. 3-233 TaxID=3417969 RepID=UPI003D34B7F4